MSYTEEPLSGTCSNTDVATSRSLCLPIQGLLHFSDRPLESLASHVRNHIDECPVCAERLVILRAGRLLADCPTRWMVHLGTSLRDCDPVNQAVGIQVLGKISFETRSFTACQEDEWLASPSAMRVNLVLNPAIEFLSLAILDAPIGVDGIAMMTANGLQKLTHDVENSEFTFSAFGDDLIADSATYADVYEMAISCKLQLVVDMADAAGNSSAQGETSDIIELLEHHQAIERNADYVLPSGRHSDTFINIANVCAQEESMHFLAAKIDFQFWDVHFDTILANGWAMSLIGRRVADAREAQGICRDQIRQVLCEGYTDPMLLDDIAPGSRVLILVDVIVTGRLVEQLRRVVRSSGANVVGVAAIVRPHGSSFAQVVNLRTLCEIEMEITDGRGELSPRSQGLSQQFFNPIAGCMTTKASAPRSPSQFLDEDANARDLWRVMQATEAYEHHRREGDTHYIGFVDTKKLLESRKVGKELTQKMADLVRKSGAQPTVFLVPGRARASLFARMLANTLRHGDEVRPQIVTVCRKWSSGKWELGLRDKSVLARADVLIIDTAAGHGRTIDQLCSLAVRAKARRVGAAVLLSRLTPPCEDSFNLRLSGGFHRLFNLAIRPVAIRGDRFDLCPVCRRKNAIRQFAEESNVEALEHWAASLCQMRRPPEKQARPPRQSQLLLFDDQPFLSACGAAVASGVTLHALGAARVNGSAPLSLPELADERIPWRARATMVENLPSGILAWTGDTLVQDFIKVLGSGEYPSVWKATANLLSREGSDLWLEHLGTLLGRPTDGGGRTTESFWNHMACNVFLLAANREETRAEIRSRIEQLLSRGVDDVARSGLQRMREVIER